MVQLSQPYMTAGKTIALTRQTLGAKVMSLLFNTLSRFVIAFLPRSKRLLIMAAVTICSDSGDQENEVCHCFHCFPTNLPWSDGTRCHGLRFSVLSFKPAFSLSSFTFIKRLFSSSSLCAIRVVCIICISEVIDISPGNLDSSLCFFQPSVSHDVLCIEVK